MASSLREALLPLLGKPADLTLAQRVERAVRDAGDDWRQGLLASLAAGYVLLALFAFAEPTIGDRAGAFAGSALIATAALLVGGAVGFLFGLPRAAHESNDASRARIHANTNLEDISDWLTKILVGVGLTQLATLPESAGSLFRAASAAFGGDPSPGGESGLAVAVAGGTLVAFSLVGFLLSFLYARTRLGPAMAESDVLIGELMDLAAKADARAAAGGATQEVPPPATPPGAANGTAHDNAADSSAPAPPAAEADTIRAKLAGPPASAED